jgi:hypothetical protein
MTHEPTSALAGEETARQPLVSATMGDGCVTCGTPLSSDQRYCVSCGERRGRPRFSLPAGGAQGVPPSPESAAPGPPPPPRPSRASSGTTVVAGVGTLLLAMGVGVLIGRNSANTVPQGQAAAPTVVTVGAGGTATTAAGGPSTSHKKTSKSKGTKAKSNSKAHAAAKPTAAQAKSAQAAASKVLGSNANLPPATVTVGATGHGPGYNKSGHFDGSFFGN